MLGSLSRNADFDCGNLERPRPTRAPSGFSMLRFQAVAKKLNPGERITIEPQICHGKLTVRGLRDTVEFRNDC